MFSRIALAAAAGLLATACASAPASTSDGGAIAPAASNGSAAATAPPSASAVTVLNIAATSHWAAEENLVPDDPVLNPSLVDAVEDRPMTGTACVSDQDAKEDPANQTTNDEVTTAAANQGIPGKTEMTDGSWIAVTSKRDKLFSVNGRNRSNTVIHH